MILCGLLAAVTLFIYSPVGNYPFVNYDDQDYVVHNLHVQSGLAWQTLSWSLTSIEDSNWHPLTWLSHALDCQLFGMNAGGHHWTNVVIHALNSVILFLLLWRVTRATGKSVLAAAFFALHPLNVESVAWVAERKNVLSTLFFFLALGAYGWYARKPGLRRYSLVALLFVLGLASKPMVITLPFVLLLIDFWPLGRIQDWSDPSPSFPVPQRRPSWLVLEKLPLLLLSAGSAVVTVVAQKENVIPTTALPLGVRLQNVPYAYGMYLWKTFWPAGLAPIYPHPGNALAAWRPLLCGFIIVAIALIAWKQRFTRPYLAVGWLWFLGTAVPVIGIMQVGLQTIADRYAYVPLVGIFVVLAWTAGQLSDRLRVAFSLRVAVATAVLAVLSFVTWRQIGYWRSSIDIWAHSLAVTKDNSVAEHGLANALFESGRHTEGMIHLRNYARLEPLDPTAHVGVGADYQDHGQLHEAIQQFESAIRATEILQRYNVAGLPPEALGITYANLAIAYAQVGDGEKAQVNMRKALETDTPAVNQMIGRLAQSLSTAPSARGYLRLGLLLLQTGHLPEAERALAQAHSLDPTLELPQAANSVERQ